MNFRDALPARRLTMRQRSTVVPPPGHPGPPFDLFLTVSHVVATGTERGINPQKIDRIANVISDLFFLVEYTLDDPIEDLLSDSVISLFDFFRRYGIYPEVIELSDDDSNISPTDVVDFPLEYLADSDASTITDEEERLLTQESRY